MKRERALKIVLVLVGLLFCAAAYPLVLMAKQDPALAMMMSLYATLGVFLLAASRNPSAHRSLIAFTAWSSFAHATVIRSLGVRPCEEILKFRGRDTFLVVLAINEPAFEVLASVRLSPKMITGNVASFIRRTCRETRTFAPVKVDKTVCL
jgi:hypothetical protein